MGLCVDGKQYVDPNFVKMLVNMGYGREAARIALQKTNNIISDSIQFIQENPCPGPSSSKSQEFLSLIEDLVPEVCSVIYNNINNPMVGNGKYLFDFKYKYFG